MNSRISFVRNCQEKAESPTEGGYRAALSLAGGTGSQGEGDKVQRCGEPWAYNKYSKFKADLSHLQTIFYLQILQTLSLRFLTC